MTPDDLLATFYRIPRLAAAELSDGGGPFGFDIHTALAVDYLITRYDCDAIIETGCNRGDTTHYLAQAYPDRVVLTCDIVPQYVDFVRERLGAHHNVAVQHCDSPQLLEQVRGQFRCPLYYLDAHWYEAWPLTRELAAIDRGIVLIDDFDNGDPRFGFDEYNGVRCGPQILLPFAERFPRYYVINPAGPFPFPCQQTGRRAGRAVCLAGLEHDYLKFSRYFARRQNVAAG